MAQFRFVRVFLSFCLEPQKDCLDWTYTEDSIYSCTWKVRQCVNSFEIQWDLILSLAFSIDLFADPMVVPIKIGQVIVPAHTSNIKTGSDLIKLYPIDDTKDMVMQLDKALAIMKELLEVMIDRKLTESECSNFESIVTCYCSEEGDADDNIRFVWCCSSDGVFLMAGVVRDENVRLRPFVTLAGFGGVPESLKDRTCLVRKFTHFCW